MFNTSLCYDELFVLEIQLDSPQAPDEQELLLKEHLVLFFLLMAHDCRVFRDASFFFIVKKCLPYIYTTECDRSHPISPSSSSLLPPMQPPPPNLLCVFVLSSSSVGTAHMCFCAGSPGSVGTPPMATPSNVPLSFPLGTGLN